MITWRETSTLGQDREEGLMEDPREVLAKTRERRPRAEAAAGRTFFLWRSPMTSPRAMTAHPMKTRDSYMLAGGPFLRRSSARAIPPVGGGIRREEEFPAIPPPGAK